MAIENLRTIKAWSAARAWTVALVVGLVGTAAAGPEGEELLRAHCSACHHENAGQFEHISTIRQTPEGWLMTLSRMHEVHRLVLDDAARDALVRYLSDTQGLAPGESMAGRFALERRPNVADLDLGADVNATCGQCHSLARVSLQRRDEEEWRQLARLHIGWPALAHTASAPDRTWLRIASGAVAVQLNARYPLKSAAWTQWHERPVPDLSGTWAVVATCRVATISTARQISSAMAPVTTGPLIN